MVVCNMQWNEWLLQLWKTMYRIYKIPAIVAIILFLKTLMLHLYDQVLFCDITSIVQRLFILKPLLSWDYPSILAWWKEGRLAKEAGRVHQCTEGCKSSSKAYCCRRQGIRLTTTSPNGHIWLRSMPLL